MRRKKFFLAPGNNSLSHVVKCLSIGEALTARGHDTLVAVGRKHAPFLRQQGIGHVVLPDIQESDESGFPSVEWFRQPEKIAACMNAEIDLMKAYRPDRALSVFRFTLKASAQLAGVPCDSLVCGCILPEFEQVLGYAGGEPGREAQQIILDGFFRYAGTKIEAAQASFGLPTRHGDVRHMLKGERTFLWDFPEFAPMPQKTDLFHVGPLVWNNWPSDAVDHEALADGDRPLAIMAFGTCTVYLPSARRLVRVLVDQGYRVLIAAGGQSEFLGVMPDDPRVVAYAFVSLHEMLPHAALLVTHGGQMTVFEALQHEVPVVVMPFQPEQAHNGVCLERLGCGVRLVPPQPFQGNPRIYIDALDRMSDVEIGAKISALVQDPSTHRCLAEVAKIIARYGGAEKVADLLEED